MKWFFKRLSEPSSYAGLGLIFAALPQLIATKGADQQAIGLLVTGIGAFAKSENQVKQ